VREIEKDENGRCEKVFSILLVFGTIISKIFLKP